MPTPDLKPRAIAALVGLRGAGPRSTAWIRNSIGDANSASTRDLLTDLRRDYGYVMVTSSGGWHLTYEGIGWCETQGLPVSDDAKAAARRHWESEHAQAVRS